MRDTQRERRPAGITRRSVVPAEIAPCNPVRLVPDPINPRGQAAVLVDVSRSEEVRHLPF
jgi:hypothetical protein